MSGCFDGIQWSTPEWFEAGDRRNAVAAILAGTLFFTGWWIMIDVAAIYPKSADFNHAYHVCGVLATISLFLVNSVSNGQVRGDAYTSGCLGQRGARLWLFIGFVLGFCSIIASLWILLARYLIPGLPPAAAGFGLFFQNLLIFAASLIYKFGRVDDSLGGWA